MFTISQPDAQAKLDQAESSALLANVFYGLGLVSGVASALLFLIRPGSDIATEEELADQSILDNLQVAPMIHPEATGVQAGFTW